MVELYASCVDHDDIDIYIQIRKVDANGKLLAHANYPMPVPVDEVCVAVFDELNYGLTLVQTRPQRRKVPRRDRQATRIARRDLRRIALD